MKKRALVVLIVAGAMCLSAAVAQQNGSTTQDQVAAQPSQSTQTSDQMSATGKPLQPPAREGFWGRVNPFARKKYVQRQTGPIRDRLNELDDLTATNSKNIKDADSRAQQGIRLASAKANEADQHAIDAGNRAQAAQQTATHGEYENWKRGAGGQQY